jgi:PilZ domain
MDDTGGTRSVRVVVLGVDARGRRCQQSVVAYDLSATGARLKGVDSPLVPGTRVDIEYSGRTVAATVMWLATSANAGSSQACIRLTDPKRCPWRGRLAEPKNVLRFPERRRSERLNISVGVHIRSAADAAEMNAYTSDVSVGGCYIETPRPFKVGTRLEIDLAIRSERFSTKGIVRASYAGAGMGIQFLDLSWQEMCILHDLLDAQRRAR